MKTSEELHQALRSGDGKGGQQYLEGEAALREQASGEVGCVGLGEQVEAQATWRQGRTSEQGAGPGGKREHQTQAASQRASKARRRLDLMERSSSSQRLV